MQHKCGACDAPLVVGGRGRPRRFCEDCVPPAAVVGMAETARAWRQATDYNATHAANRRGSFENRDLRRTVDDETRAYLPTLLEDPCAYCGDESTEFDHIVAESHGGSSTWDNLVGVCRSCNAQKQQLGPISYLLYRRLRADAEEIAQQRALLRLAA